MAANRAGHHCPSQLSVMVNGSFLVFTVAPRNMFPYHQVHSYFLGSVSTSLPHVSLDLPLFLWLSVVHLRVTKLGILPRHNMFFITHSIAYKHSLCLMEIVCFDCLMFCDRRYQSLTTLYKI